MGRSTNRFRSEKDSNNIAKAIIKMKRFSIAICLFIVAVNNNCDGEPICLLQFPLYTLQFCVYFNNYIFSSTQPKML